MGRVWYSLEQRKPKAEGSHPLIDKWAMPVLVVGTLVAGTLIIKAGHDNQQEYDEAKREFQDCVGEHLDAVRPLGEKAIGLAAAEARETCLEETQAADILGSFVTELVDNSVSRYQAMASNNDTN